MLLTGDVLDWISTAYKQILDLQTGLTSKSAIQFLFLLSVIMSSAVLSALLGVETLAPKMVTMIFRELKCSFQYFLALFFISFISKIRKNSRPKQEDMQQLFDNFIKAFGRNTHASNIHICAVLGSINLLYEKYVTIFNLIRFNFQHQKLASNSFIAYNQNWELLYRDLIEKWQSSLFTILFQSNSFMKNLAVRKLLNTILLLYHFNIKKSCNQLTFF